MSAAVTSAPTKPEIIIDLSQPLSSLLSSSKNSDDSHPILQEDAAQRIEKLLTNFHEQAKNHTKNQYDEFNPVRCNNTIFIDGERGAGKTTFLYSILQKYKNEKNEKKNNNLNICPLPLIDPTLVETHQHILIEIVTKFVRQLDKKLKCCQDESKYQQFREHLDVMAEGLQLLNKKDISMKEPTDSSWFLEKALNKATNGQDLERHFHQFLDIISDMHDIDLFLIAIDDVDTQTTKADEVLEVIRCYLTHPKLVILLSGDLKLYSHIVRNNKHTELNEQKNQKNDTAEALIGHLEQQYLAKILPVEQRIQLKKLDELSEKYEVKIKHSNLSKEKNDGVENPIEIRELISTIFSQALYFRKEHLKSHLDFLLSQPVRSVLQLLKTMLDAIDPSKENNSYQASTLKNAIYQSFIGDLVNENLKLENLSKTPPHINSIAHELFKILHQNGDLETGFYTRPDSNYDQSGYNVAKIYLSSTMASLFFRESKNSNFSNSIKIMLTANASSNIFQGYIQNIEKNDEDAYLNYIGITRNEDITSITPHFSYILLDDDRASKHGIIRIPRRVRYSIKESSEYSFDSKSRIKSLDSLWKNHWITKGESWSLSDYIAAKAILISSHSIAINSENRDYISCYSLLAAISEIFDENSKKDITSLSSIITYASPHFLQRDKVKDDHQDQEEDSIEINNNDLDLSKKLYKLIEEWKNLNIEISSSSLMMGKIWARIYYSLQKISSKSMKEVTLGELFSRFIWTIINSSLIEEFRYTKNDSALSKDLLSNAKNIETAPDSLRININSLKDINFKDQLPLTYTLIRCPLLWPFLGSSDINSTIRDLISLSEGVESGALKSFNEISNNIDPKNLKISSIIMMGSFKSEGNQQSNDASSVVDE